MTATKPGTLVRDACVPEGNELMHFTDPRGWPDDAAQVRCVVGESDELTRVTAPADDYFPGSRPFPLSGRTVISLRGGLDFAAAPALRERLIDVLHRSVDLLILDLSHVTSCDAAGLAVLIGTQRRAGLLGITMHLVAPSFPVSKALGVTGLKRNFTIYSDLSGVLAPERHEPAGPARAPAGAVREPPLDLLACSPPLSA
jgi:anti-anti-sigma factor